MPRKNPLSELDQGIARRLVELRKRTGLSRDQLAARLTWPPHFLARIELARMPLRYADGKTLLRALLLRRRIEPVLRPINPLWLVESLEPKEVDWPLVLPEIRDLGLDPSAAFSYVVQLHRDLIIQLVNDPTSVELPDSWLPAYYLHWDQLSCMTHTLREDAAIVEHLLRTSAEKLAPSSKVARRTLDDYRATILEPIAIPRRWKGLEIFKRQVLTEHSEYCKSPSMQSKLLALLDRVKRLTLCRGMKAALASAINVQQPRISEWLAGKYEPSGETTLKLLHWVEQQEAKQQQSPGSVQPPPGPKTQLGNLNEKKTKSSPRKR